MGKISEILVRQQIFPSTLFAFHFFLLPLQANNQFINNYGRLPGGKLQFVMAGDKWQGC